MNVGPCGVPRDENQRQQISETNGQVASSILAFGSNASKSCYFNNFARLNH